jgi:uncharacterized MAPEG superfamily protein
MLFSNLSMKTLLLGAIAVEAFLVYLPFVAVALARVTNDYDISAPRAMIDKLPDWAKRANWAHQNAWEAFAIFTAAALVAYVSGLDNETARLQVMAHVAARVLFPVFYIANIPLLRSLMFAVGSVCAFSLMFASVTQSMAG